MAAAEAWRWRFLANVIDRRYAFGTLTKRSLSLLAVTIVLTGFTAVSAVGLLLTLRFPISRYVLTEGVIAGYLSDSTVTPKGIVFYAPQVDYVLPGGDKSRAIGEYSSTVPDNAVIGTRVSVWYRVDDPRTAYLGDPYAEALRFGYVFGISTLLLALIAVAQIPAVRRRLDRLWRSLS